MGGVKMDWQTLAAIGLVLLSGVWMAWHFVRPFCARRCGGEPDDDLLQIAPVDEGPSLN